MFKTAYWLFSYLGVMTLSATFIKGFKYDAAAPFTNLYINIGLYVAFFAVHIVMTMPAFKRAVFGQPGGTPVERRN